MMNIEEKLIVKVIEYNTDSDANIILSLLPGYVENEIIYLTLKTRIIEVYKGDMIVQTLDNFIGVLTKDGKKYILN